MKRPAKGWTWFTDVMLRDQSDGRMVRTRVDLTFDLDRIAKELGLKALNNKSGRSKLALGITAEARRRD